MCKKLDFKVRYCSVSLLTPPPPLPPSRPASLILNELGSCQWLSGGVGGLSLPPMTSKDYALVKTKIRREHGGEWAQYLNNHYIYQLLKPCYVSPPFPRISPWLRHWGLFT